MMRPPVGTRIQPNITAAGNLAGMNNTSQVINNGLSSERREYALWGTGLLIMLMEKSGNSALTDQEIQGAIWQLSAGVCQPELPDPPAVSSGTFQGEVTWYEDRAESNPLTSGFEVVTAANEATQGAGAYQEYIVMTPEPSTLLLMGLGLISFFCLSRRKAIFRGRGFLASPAARIACGSLREPQQVMQRNLW